MGKHEREKVQIAETIVNDILNENSLKQSQKQHEFYEYSKEMAKRIKNDFPEIKKSIHVGNTYGSSLGDLKLITEEENYVYLELKFLESGHGTHANIGQNTLTDLDLFEEDAKPWKEFRIQKNHTSWVREELNRFKDYPPEVENITTGTKKEIKNKAKYLKEVINTKRGQETKKVAEEILGSKASTQNQIKAAKIIKNIVNKDRKEKLEYIDYLKDLEQNKDNIKKFLFLMVSGFHTKEARKEKWELNLSEIIKVLKQEYYNYYLYKSKNEIKINSENYSEKLKDLLDNEVFISFRENQTRAFISYKNERGNEVPILKLVFHWKNKFQGIQTPCINVFHGEYLK